MLHEAEEAAKALVTARVQAPTLKLLETALVSGDAGAMGDSPRAFTPAISEARIRAVLAGPPSQVALAIGFAALVDDPSSLPHRFPTHAEQDVERERLFELMARLTRPGARRDTALLDEVRAVIRTSCLRPTPPDVHDLEQLYAASQDFRGQEDLGDDTTIAALFAERREGYERAGVWRGTLLELRGCLWYFWLWAERMGGGSAGTKADESAVRALYRQVRAQWGELAEDVERALEPYRAPRVTMAQAARIAG
jgi:hypothetical protein